jgi:hypothetical protein
MKNEIRNMLKTAIEENAIEFKDKTSKVLYEKIGHKLETKYKEISKTIFQSKSNETDNRTN